ncbi:MAG: hypothetical protein JKY65_31340 [Planctomycetes bacterium]|nr:hypothetical protein [Planctomycetota bacterium]
MLGRLRDFWADAVFTGADLPALREEISYLLNHDLSPQAQESLVVLGEACRAAGDDDSTLFVFCD